MISISNSIGDNASPCVFIFQEIITRIELKNQLNLYSQHGVLKCSCFSILIVHCYFGNKFLRKTHCVCSNERVLNCRLFTETVSI